jgi:hypothetical protein
MQNLLRCSKVKSPIDGKLRNAFQCGQAVELSLDLGIHTVSALVQRQLIGQTRHVFRLQHSRKFDA